MGRVALTVKKIVAPAHRTGYFSRSRLLNLLYESMETDLFLLKSPAGYGKTSLLADFVQRIKVPACWYNVEETDADLRTFLEYLIASVRRHFPSFGAQVETLLEASLDPDNEIPVLMGAFANGLHALDEVLLIVLDDYHVVNTAATVNAALYSLLLYLPDNAHVVVSGREAPNIPLSDLIVYQRVAGMGQEDLAFSEEEIYELIVAQRKRHGSRPLMVPADSPQTQVEGAAADTTGAASNGLPLDEAAARKLAAELAYETEGWIMGILLGLQARQPGLLRPIPSDLRGHAGREALFQYLSRQVFGRLPQETQDFLLQTVVLEHLDAAVCAAMTGLTVAEAAERLEELYRSQLFIFRIDEEVGDRPAVAWLHGPTGNMPAADVPAYRYHQLFRAFLLSMLDREHAERSRRALEKVAGRYYLRSGELADVVIAMPHLIRAGDYGPAAASIEAFADGLLSEHRRALVQSWMDRLPRELLHAHPGLYLIQARLAYLGGDAKTALESADIAAWLFKQRNDTRRRARALVQRGYYAGIQGKYPEAIENCREVTLLAGSGLANFVTIAEAHKNLGAVYAMQRRLPEALRQFYEALSYYETMGETAGIADVTLEMAGLQLVEGDLAQAHTSYQRAVNIWRQLNNAAKLCLALNNLGVLLHHLGQYTEALQVIEEGLSRSQESGNIRLEAGAEANRGDVLYELGSYPEAQAAFEAGAALAERAGDSFFHNYCLDGVARCYLATGDLDRAEHFAARAVAGAESAGSGYERGLYSMTVGLIQAERGQETSAIAMLTSATGVFAGAGVRRDETIARLRLAQLLFKTRRLDEALQHLRRAYTLIGELGSPAVLRGQLRFVLPVVRYGLTVSVTPPSIEPQELAQQEQAAGVKPQDQRERQTTHQVRVYALNGVRVLVDGQEIAASRWRSSVARSLFFYLLQFPRGVRREKIVEALWPDAEPGGGDAKLYTSVYRLRKALWKGVLVAEGQTYRLNLGDDFWYDVQEFERLIARAHKHPTNTPERIKLQQLAGELLVTPYLDGICEDEWAYGRRRRLEEEQIRLLLEIAAFAERQRALDAAIACYTRVLQLDPLHEEANGRMMRCHIEQGQRSIAVALYRTYAHSLHEELGQDPPAAIRALFAPPRNA
jgi:LuxR family maltose regulon positive regulatory protein